MRHSQEVRDSLRVLVVSNMIPSLEVPQYGVFVARQTRALEQNGCTVEIVGLQKQATGKLGTARKYNGLRSRVRSGAPIASSPSRPRSPSASMLSTRVSRST